MGDIVELIELCLRRSMMVAVVVDGGGRRRGFWLRRRSWRLHMRALEVSGSGKKRRLILVRFAREIENARKHQIMRFFILFGA